MATRTHRLVPALPLSLAVVCAACAATGPEVTLEDHAPFVAAAGGQGPSLRGLAAPGPDLAWVSGSGGVVARTTDGGRSWSVGDVGVDAADLDLRMLVAFDADHAWAGAAGPGDASRLFETTDGGATWRERLRNDDPEGFWDGLAFWDRDHGLLVGDPTVDPATGARSLTLLVTADGGRSWDRVPADVLPAPAEGVGPEGEPLTEYAFAASNRSIALWRGRGEAARGAGGARDGRSSGISGSVTARHAWVGTGGAAARVLHTADGGRTWSWADTPLAQDDPAAGVFALDVAPDGRHLVAVGGRYDLPEVAVATAAWSADAGVTWTAADPAPGGYRSAVAFAPVGTGVGASDDPPTAYAAGTAGTSTSRPGRPGTWVELEDLPGANALAFEPRRDPFELVLWGVGPGPAVWRATLDFDRLDELDDGHRLFLDTDAGHGPGGGRSGASASAGAARVHGD